jgi:hypothetical protein
VDDALAAYEALLLIQAGTHEVLLDDAIRLARRSATADVEVTLDITPNASPCSERTSTPLAS